MKDNNKTICKVNKPILLGFLLAWSYLAVSGFYEHFPIGYEYIVDLLDEFLLFITIELSVIGTGNQVLKLFKISETGFLKRLGFSFGLGMICISILYTVLGFLHLIYPLTGIIVLAVFLIVGSSGLVALFKNFNFKERFKRDNLIIAVPVFFLFLLIPMVLAPPVSIDALVYHLAVPKQIVSHTGFFPTSYNSHANFPLYIEMIYTLALSLGTGTVAKMINFSFALILMITVPGIVEENIPRRYAFLSQLIFFTMPVVLIASAWALVDIPLTFYFLLTCWFAFRFMEEQSYNYLILAAIFAGFSAGIKYSALLFLFSLIAGWIYIEKKSFFSKDRIKLFLLFALIALVIGSPWYIKNLINFGNPLYPLNFSGSGELLFHKGETFDLKHSFIRIFNYAVGSNYIDEVIGFLPLIFFPYIIFIKRNKFLDFIAITSIISLIFTTVIFSPSARIVLPAILLVTLLSGTVIARMWNLQITFRITVLLLIILSTASTIPIYHYTAKTFDPLPVVFGNETRKEYLNRIRPEYRVINYANKHLNKPRVIFLYCHSTYYADFDYISSAPTDPLPIRDKIRKAKDSNSLLKNLLNRGFTHIILNKAELSRSSPPGKNKLLNILNKSSRLFVNKNFALLELPGN